jgi:predicted alpha/beta hydrolase family esterase
MGGSTSVKLQQRVQVWLETLTALLDLLKIKHVVLVGHSSGTIYLLNTLVHMRDVLSPKKPYVVLLG